MNGTAWPPYDEKLLEDFQESKNSIGSSLAFYGGIALLILGFGVAGVGIYAFLSQGVINAFLGEIGGISLMSGGGGLIFLGFIATVIGGVLKLRQDKQITNHSFDSTVPDEVVNPMPLPAVEVYTNTRQGEQ